MISRTAWAPPAIVGQRLPAMRLATTLARPSSQTQTPFWAPPVIAQPRSRALELGPPTQTVAPRWVDSRQPSTVASTLWTATADQCSPSLPARAGRMVSPSTLAPETANPSASPPTGSSTMAAASPSPSMRTARSTTTGVRYVPGRTRMRSPSSAAATASSISCEGRRVPRVHEQLAGRSSGVAASARGRGVRAARPKDRWSHGTGSAAVSDSPVLRRVGFTVRGRHGLVVRVPGDGRRLQPREPLPGEPGPDAAPGREVAGESGPRRSRRRRPAAPPGRTRCAPGSRPRRTTPRTRAAGPRPSSRPPRPG